jgi:hypothetical protein
VGLLCNSVRACMAFGSARLRGMRPLGSPPATIRALVLLGLLALPAAFGAWQSGETAGAQAADTATPTRTPYPSLTPLIYPTAKAGTAEITVSGTVSDQYGNPVPFATVEVWRRALLIQEPPPLWTVVTTDAAGKYAVTLPRSTYDFIGRKVGYAPPEVIQVPGVSSTETSAFVANPPLAIRDVPMTGTVRDASTGAPVPGVIVKSVIKANGVPSNWEWLYEALSSSSTGPDGTYSYLGIPGTFALHYIVQVNADGYEDRRSLLPNVTVGAGGEVRDWVLPTLSFAPSLCTKLASQSQCYVSVSASGLPPNHSFPVSLRSPIAAASSAT